MTIKTIAAAGLVATSAFAMAAPAHAETSRQIFNQVCARFGGGPIVKDQTAYTFTVTTGGGAELLDTQAQINCKFGTGEFVHFKYNPTTGKPSVFSVDTMPIDQFPVEAMRRIREFGTNGLSPR